MSNNNVDNETYVYSSDEEDSFEQVCSWGEEKTNDEGAANPEEDPPTKNHHDDERKDDDEESMIMVSGGANVKDDDDNPKKKNHNDDEKDLDRNQAKAPTIPSCSTDNGDNNNKNKNNIKIELELPREFLQQQQDPTEKKTNGDVLDQHPDAGGASFAASSVSSFIPVQRLAALGIHNNNNSGGGASSVASSVSDWTHGGMNMAPLPTASTVGATTVAAAVPHNATAATATASSSANNMTTRTTSVAAPANNNDAAAQALWEQSLSNLSASLRRDARDHTDNGSLTTCANDDAASQTSTWSVVYPGSTSTATNDDDRTPSANNNDDTSSVISGFDLLDIHGVIIRHCHACHFHNQQQGNLLFCQGCGRALVNNPCPDMDAQIQRHLANKELTDAEEELRRHERKRAILGQQPLLEQARAVVQVVHNNGHADDNLLDATMAAGASSHASRSGWLLQDQNKVGYHMVPAADLLRSTLRFLECARERHAGTLLYSHHDTTTVRPIQLYYTFTSKHCGRIQLVQKWGFGNAGVPLLASAQDAHDYYQQYQVNQHHGNRMRPIWEHDNDSPAYVNDAVACVGWVVAAAPGRKQQDYATSNTTTTAGRQDTEGYRMSQPSRRHSIGGSVNDAGDDDTANNNNNQVEGLNCYNVCTVYGDHAVLPLMCFDASLRNDKETQTKFKALEQRCLDLFHDLGLLGDTTTGGVQETAANNETASSTAESPLSSAESPLSSGRDESPSKKAKTDDSSDESTVSLGSSDPPSEKAQADDNKDSLALLQDQTRGAIMVGNIQMRTCAYCDCLVKIFTSCPRGCDETYGNQDAAIEAAIAASLQDSNKDSGDTGPDVAAGSNCEGGSIPAAANQFGATDSTVSDQALPQGIRKSTPTWRPSLTLQMSRDPIFLCKYQCLFRQHMELFEVKSVETTATGSDSNNNNDSYPSATKRYQWIPPSNSTRQVAGQVGLRCRHCAMQDDSVARAATYFPEKINGVYHAAHILANGHLAKTCQMIPASVRQELIDLKNLDKTLYGESKEYWAKSLAILGVYEDIQGKCLRFEQR